MKTKILALAGVAALALSASATASYAGYMQPGETMGVSLDSPLPEGVFFADLENYGKQDNSGGEKIGVNIPVILWSTPWTFYNTRLEFLAALPFAHLDGPTVYGGAGANPVGAITYAFGPILAHDFGNGLTGGISAFVRTADPTQAIATFVSLRHATELDLRQSLQYTFNFGGPLGAITVIENGGITTGFSTPGNIEGENDFFAGDFTVEKTFDKLTVGFTGYGNIDINNRATCALAACQLYHNLNVGGLIAYDFGKFSLTGIVTRGIQSNGITQGVSLGTGPETRGWVRLVVPLWVAPTAPVVTARYGSDASFRWNLI